MDPTAKKKRSFNVAFMLLAAIGVIVLQEVWIRSQAVATIRYSEFQKLVRDREAVAKRDVHLAAERGEALKKKLREAGAAVYSQTPGSAYGHVPPTGPAPGEARPTGAGPRGKVVDAEYQEKKSS